MSKRPYGVLAVATSLLTIVAAPEWEFWRRLAFSCLVGVFVIAWDWKRAPKEGE